ncbi:MAG TPA: antibiotic biosynthesis monooxygenase [Candidatus Binataceae bacterium]|nr:antibiotic biosynthesis monooxygenase [Candidatus Binataceae bacterium]
MPAIPWKSLGPVDPDREYLMLLSFLPLKTWGALPRFVLHTRRITGQLGRANGLIGYSLLARPLAKQFFTLSVWENEAALNAFVRASPHAATMAELMPHMGQTRFVKRPIKGSEIPPAWDYALTL